MDASPSSIRPQATRKRRRTQLAGLSLKNGTGTPHCFCGCPPLDRRTSTAAMEDTSSRRRMRVSTYSLGALLFLTVCCGMPRNGVMGAAAAAWTSALSSSTTKLLRSTQQEQQSHASLFYRWSIMALDSRELRFFGGTRVLAPFAIADANHSTSSHDTVATGLEHDFSQFMQSGLLSGGSSSGSSTTTGSSTTSTSSVQTLQPVLTSLSTPSPLSSTAQMTAPDELSNKSMPHFYTSQRYASILDASTAFQTLKKTTDTICLPKSQSYRSIQRSTAATSPVSRTNPLSAQNNRSPPPHPQTGYGPSIRLTPEESNLFDLLRRVRSEMGLQTTLRVAGGWVRDKLLATPEFRAYHRVFAVGSCAVGGSVSTARLTSKFRRTRDNSSGGGGGSTSGNGSMGRQGTKVLISPPRSRLGNDDATGQPVDIDIALDDMLGREFANRLNEYLTTQGQDTVTVGMVLKNPEKSKHLETATMKVGPFWIDFVNLRAEEYTQDSRIPDLMRIGTADEDAFRRDLTINSLFYNVNTGQIEDWTGRGFQDLRKGVISTPLHPLTTLLDDPLRVLRSIRFAARLRFTMDDDLVEAAKTASVAEALSQKVSRERVGGELDLMLRSPDPVGAVRLLINLKLANCVFPITSYYRDLISQQFEHDIPIDRLQKSVSHVTTGVFQAGLELLSTAHDHLADCRWSPPTWCMNKSPAFGAEELRLVDDEESRRLLWYAAFLKPQYDEHKTLQTQSQRTSRRHVGTKKTNRSIVIKMLVDELKRPARDADSIESIIKAADDFTQLLDAGCDVSATMILLSNVQVAYTTQSTSGDELTCDLEVDTCDEGKLSCSMNGRIVDSENEDDPVWEHAMEFRLLCSKVLQRVGPLWRAALFLAISEELVKTEKLAGIEYAIEGDVVDESQDERRQGVLERFDTFAAALQQIGLIGIWNEKPVANGNQVTQLLPRIPKGPAFREVMDEQVNWMVTHPGGGLIGLTAHLSSVFPDYSNATSDTPKL